MSEREVPRGEIDDLEKEKGQPADRAEADRPLHEDLDLASRLEILEARLAQRSGGDAAPDKPPEPQPSSEGPEGPVEAVQEPEK